MSKDTMTANEAAMELGVELNYLYNLVRTGRLKAQKQDGEWVVSAQAVDARLERLSARNSS
jgi:excisionase family DNA binding protein